MSLTSIPLSQIKGATELHDQYVSHQLLDYGGLRQELDATGVTLKEDPVEEGLSKLNGLIAQVDAQKTRVATVVNMSIEHESNLEVLYKQALALFKKEYDARLPFPPVADFSNAASREAACNSVLRDLKDLVEVVSGTYAQAKAFTKMAQNDLVKLDSTNKNISRQITVLQLSNEIGEIGRSGNPHTFNKEQ